MERRFRNREDAGRMLAEHLKRYANRPDAVALGLPRGGVRVAYEAAQMLKLPLDVLVVRKLGVPGQPELAMGAIASGGLRVLNRDIVNQLGIASSQIDAAVERETAELSRQEDFYRSRRAGVSPRDKTVILIDDGLATGATMRVAVSAVRKQGPASITVAVPVASRSARDDLQREVEEVVCLHLPEHFMSVGAWYEDFSQMTDDEVRKLLQDRDA